LWFKSYFSLCLRWHYSPKRTLASSIKCLQLCLSSASRLHLLSPSCSLASWYTASIKSYLAHLKWNVQVKQLCSKLGKVCYVIKSLKEVMSPYIIRCIYYAHFQALLTCDIIFLDGDNDRNNIFKLQKRVIRIISGVSKHTSCRQIFTDYNILTVTCLYILEIACYIKKYRDSPEQNVKFHNYNTRRKLYLHVQFCSTELFKKSVVNMGIRL
jgi:hypothetical protein